MQQRLITNDTVFLSATEPILYGGCDYRLYWVAFGLCVLCAIGLFAMLPLPYSLYAIGGDAAVFILLRWGLRQMAKADPLLRQVYPRHLKWQAYYPAKGKILLSRHPNRLRKK
jgi:type IV secretory pathway TrbD component